MNKFAREALFSGLVFGGLVFLPVNLAHAASIVYTLSGSASGSISGTTNATFSDAAFTITYTEDTSSLVSAGGYYSYPGISGTFTEGSYTTTLTNTQLEVNSNGNTGMGAYETLFLFNSNDFGTSIGMSEISSLLGYGLTAPFTTGVQTSNIGAFFDTAGYSTTTGDTVDITALQSLDFTAANVPEPSSILLLSTGLSGLGLLRQRFRLQQSR